MTGAGPGDWLPDPAVLMALCASRCGEPAWAYANSRTEGQFTLDVMAWVSSWSAPASALLGGGGKGEGGGTGEGRGTYSRIPENYSWLRKSSASRVSFTDLDELDRAGAGSQGDAMMAMSFPVANNETMKSWEKKVAARAVRVDARSGATLGSVRRSGGGRRT